MIIVSSRKFRDSQNEYFELAKKEEVILKTLHYGNFRLVPIKEPKAKQEKKKTTGKKSNASIYIPDELLKNIITETNNTVETEVVESKSTLNNDIVEKEQIQSPTPVVVAAENESKPVAEHVQIVETVSKTEEAKEIVEVNSNTEIVENSEPAIEPELEKKTYTKLSTEIKEPEKSEEPKEKVEVNYIEEKLKSTLSNTVESSNKEPNKSSQKANESSVIEEGIVKEEWKPGNVFVDPSLLSLEEVRIQEGLDELNKKESFFTKIFKKKK